VPADVVQLVNVYFATEGIAMDTEYFGGAGLIPVDAFEDTLDEFLLEFSHGLFEKDSALDHHPDQRFELIFHRGTLRITTMCAAMEAARRT
jgi:hypothetical protein